MGIAVGAKSQAYLTGYTNSSDYSITPGVYQTDLGGVSDAFVSKFDLGVPACPMMKLTPGTLPDAMVGATYPDQLMLVAGTTGAIPFSVSKGTLPPWMVLSSTGFLSGSIVNNLGVYTFTITAKDMAGCEVSQDYTITSSLSKTSLLCLVDDVNPTKRMAIDFVTGEYSVVSGTVRLRGTGIVTVTSGQLELTDRSAGKLVNVRVGRVDGKGQAVMKIADTSLKGIIIRDTSILDNSCPMRP